MKKYVALIADIVSSKERNNQDRRLIQEKLYFVVKKVNYIFRDRRFDVIFSSGDSIECLFNDLETAIQVYLFLKTFIKPIEMRFGFGIGEVYSNLSRESIESRFLNSNFIDGPCYHKARKALDICKENKYEAYVVSDDGVSDLVFNGILRANYLARSGLSNSQSELMFLYDIINPVLDFQTYIMYSKNFSNILNDIVLYDDLYNIQVKHLSDAEYAKKFISYFYNNKRNLDIFNFPISKGLDTYSRCILKTKDDEFIAELLSVTIQNISNLRRQGNLKDIRNNDIYLCLLARKLYDGGNKL